MLKILSKISQLMSEIDFVKATVKKVKPPIEVGGIKIGLDSEGMEIQIPRWLSNKMLEQGVIEVKGVEDISVKDLRKILWKESRETSLTKMDPQFYAKAKRIMQKINEEIKKSPTPEKLQDKKRYEDTLTDIINCRMQKIIQLALTESIPPTIMENITVEERILLKEIKWILLTWREQMTSWDEEV
ncbi:MAG: hypothetical protein QXI93_00375 [Candidatus Methanomethylicia archaeon]